MFHQTKDKKLYFDAPLNDVVMNYVSEMRNKRDEEMEKRVNTQREERLKLMDDGYNAMRSFVRENIKKITEYSRDGNYFCVLSDEENRETIAMLHHVGKITKELDGYDNYPDWETFAEQPSIKERKKFMLILLNHNAFYCGACIAWRDIAHYYEEKYDVEIEICISDVGTDYPDIYFGIHA